MAQGDLQHTDARHLAETYRLTAASWPQPHVGLKVLPSATNFGLARMQNVISATINLPGTGTVIPSLPGTATFPGTHEPGQRANASRRQGGGRTK